MVIRAVEITGPVPSLDDEGDPVTSAPKGQRNIQVAHLEVKHADRDDADDREAICDAQSSLDRPAEHDAKGEPNGVRA